MSMPPAMRATTFSAAIPAPTPSTAAAARTRWIGGEGADYYLVDSLDDVVNEATTNAKGGGIDTVESLVTYSLAARVNVDHLILTGGGNSNGTGNALNNEITGNTGNNLLNGGTGNDVLTGGDGNDKLTGGTGNDIFDFNLVSELGDLDVITDFKKGAGPARHLRSARRADSGSGHLLG